MEGRGTLQSEVTLGGRGRMAEVRGGLRSRPSAPPRVNRTEESAAARGKRGGLGGTRKGGVWVMWMMRISPEEVDLLWSGRMLEKSFISDGKRLLLSLATYDENGRGLVIGLEERPEHA